MGRGLHVPQKNTEGRFGSPFTDVIDLISRLRFGGRPAINQASIGDLIRAANPR